MARRHDTEHALVTHRWAQFWTHRPYDRNLPIRFRRKGFTKAYGDGCQFNRSTYSNVTKNIFEKIIKPLDKLEIV